LLRAARAARQQLFRQDLAIGPWFRQQVNEPIASLRISIIKVVHGGQGM
jgi:hypothetical protein